MSSRITAALWPGLLRWLLAVQLPVRSMAQSTPSLPTFVLLSSISSNTEGVTITTAKPSPLSEKSGDEESPSVPLLTRTPTATAPLPTRTHTIQVGLADHKFRPEVTTAAVGDIIHFTFYPTNHSVVRAEYGFPCIPYEMTGPSKVGFATGFFPVDSVLSSPPHYAVRVNDTAPMFFYCSAPGSCLTYGMVGAVNPNASTPVSQQREAALKAAYMLNPGEPFPDESIPPFQPTSPSSPSGALAEHHHHHHDLSTGAIAGIAVAGTAVLILALLLIIILLRRRRKSQSRTTSPNPHVPPEHRHPDLHPHPPPPEEPHMLDSPGASGGFLQEAWHQTYPPRTYPPKYDDGLGLVSPHSHLHGQEGVGVGDAYAHARGLSQSNARSHSAYHAVLPGVKPHYGHGRGGVSAQSNVMPGRDAPVEMEGASAVPVDTKAGM